MWPFKKKTEPPPLHPPIGLPLADFKKAQDDYVTKYDKMVKPTQLLGVEAAKLSADFGKMAIAYLVLGNAGGLAALVVLAPIMHDTNQLWLAQRFLTAMAFGFGAAFAVGVAVIAHFNYASHGWFFWNQWRRDDNWIKTIEFGFDENWRRATDTWFLGEQKQAGRRADITNALAVLVFLASAGCWIYGAVTLAMSVVEMTPS